MFHWLYRYEGAGIHSWPDPPRCPRHQWDMRSPQTPCITTLWPHHCFAQSTRLGVQRGTTKIPVVGLTLLLKSLLPHYRELKRKILRVGCESHKLTFAGVAGFVVEQRQTCFFCFGMIKYLKFWSLFWLDIYGNQVGFFKTLGQRYLRDVHPGVGR